MKSEAFPDEQGRPRQISLWDPCNSWMPITPKDRFLYEDFDTAATLPILNGLFYFFKDAYFTVSKVFGILYAETRQWRQQNVQSVANRKGEASAFVQERCQPDWCTPGRQIDFDRNADSAECEKVVA